MNHRVSRIKTRSILPIVFIMFMTLLGGCASTVPPVQPAAAPEPPGVPAISKKQITGIQVAEEAENVLVSISANQMLTYTSVKQPHPLGIVLYFPETTIAPAVASRMPGSDIVSSVQSEALKANENTSRIAIELNADASYLVRRNDNGLTVSIPKAQAKDEPPRPAAELPAEAPMPVAPATAPPVGLAATELQSVSAATVGQSTQIVVAADGSVRDFKSFTLESPPRIVFELMGLNSPYPTEQFISVGSPWVKKVRHFAYPEKLRLVVDTTAPYLASFSARAVETGLVIRVGEDARDQSDDAPAMVIQAAKKRPAQSSTATVAASLPVVGKASWVNRIDFVSEDAGKSTVLIGTTDPAEYSLKKAGERLLQLTLKNTRLPDYRERPLITTRFESAVDRIIPVRQPGQPENALFTIELRQSVPYFVEQKSGLLLVHFEASSAPPQPFEKKKLPAWEAVLAQAQAAEMSAETTTEEDDAPLSAPQGVAEKLSVFSGKRYSGEKIALDFFETDIKNVFRILKEVSGKNFAIDKDVSGKVTLSFQKPVPWDQVLDLILQMNQLGKIVDGEIVRIATISTLKKEEDDRQAALAAQQKASEQEMALEPLITEYLPVNYANAKSEVMPHLQNIITEGRGNVSVDERSNQVILTDVAAKISQAKAMVKKLDTVTPQVIIEARVVEVTNNFSKDLGIDWSASSTDIQKDFLGGLVDWDVAMNFPASSSSSIGFNFDRIAGTPLLLDARLTAIQVKGQAKIISAPKIVTLDNKKARIKQGLEVAYLERDDAGGSSIKFKSVDLLLEVTPHVTPDQRVSMEIYITKNDVNDIVDGIPVLGTNEAETELLVNDGETIVIGGILKRTKSSGGSEFPGLSSIPVVNWLFKNKSTVDNTGELLIFITPQIVQLAQR